MRKLVVILLTVVFPFLINGQTNKERAEEKLRKAIDLMDSGSPDLAIPLLEEAKKIDPETFIYDYEMGYAYMVKKDYKAGAEALKRALKFKDATDICYQMLGSLYDYDGQPQKALKTFDEGIKKFPKSGRLWLEKGNVYWIQKKYEEALPFYEEGIKADPAFPSNYYRLSLLFLNSEEEVWGMIYGEIFLNLERNSARNDEISGLLFNTYKKQIKFSSDTTITVSFSRNVTINISLNELKNLQQLKVPFGVLVYEPLLILSLIGEKEINLESLSRSRERFIKLYFEKEHNKKYNIPLFEFNKEIIDAGFSEAYSMWVLREGDSDGFMKWREENENKWTEFIDWFNQHQIPITEDKYFIREK